jgi:acyl-CoA thioesterase-1
MILYELRASIRYGLERMAFKRFYRLLPAAVFTLLLGVIAAAAEPYRIVGFGDSLMAGYQLDAGQSFPEKLEAALKARGHDVTVANAGVSGDTTSAGLSRLDWSVPDDTDLVILELGANDMLRGIAPELTEKNLTAMIERLKERGIPVILAGMMAAPNLGADYGDRFNRIYPALAEKYELPFYPFFLDGVAAEKSLLLEDGMHPNPQGVDRMVEGFLPVIEKVLAARTPD